MQTALKILTCKHCGSTGFDKQGKLNLHEYHCGLKKAAGQAPSQKKTVAAENCEHKFRLLNPRVKGELNAMENDYEEVCTKCQELQ
jgi:hypothetical protein